jgi:hypothetical protein
MHSAAKGAAVGAAAMAVTAGGSDDFDDEIPF